MSLAKDKALNGISPDGQKQIDRFDKSKALRNGKQSAEKSRLLHPDLVKAKQQDQGASKKSLFQPVLNSLASDHLGRGHLKPSISTKNKEQGKSSTSFAQQPEPKELSSNPERQTKDVDPLKAKNDDEVNSIHT